MFKTIAVFLRCCGRSKRPCVSFRRRPSPIPGPPLAARRSIAAAAPGAARLGAGLAGAARRAQDGGGAGPGAGHQPGGAAAARPLHQRHRGRGQPGGALHLRPPRQPVGTYARAPAPPRARPP